MIITKKHLPRRTILRGLGATIALPLLDSMVPAYAALRTTAANPVRRLASVYIPMGVNMPQWTPQDAGTLKLSPILKVLEPFQEQMLILSNLDSEGAMPTPTDGGGAHSRVQPSWATGVHVKKTDGPGFQAGTSMDQIAAEQVGHETQLSSIELALESVDTVGACELGYTCAYTSTIAWRSPTAPLPMEVNPRAIFEQLFGDSDSTDTASRLARARRNQSILDLVNDDLSRLKIGIGPNDKTKVDEYLDAIRELERRIQKAEEQSALELPTIAKPVGAPTGYEEHGRLMFDLLALAYQADLTRISSFMMGRELSVRTFPEIGISEPHHPLSHHGNNPEKLARQAKLNMFQLKIFSHFLERLSSIPDGDGTLLDHTMILYGSGMSNSDQHLPREVPTLVVAGKNTDIKTQKHLVLPKGTPLTNLQLTLLERMNCQMESYGDSTGTLNLLSI